MIIRIRKELDISVKLLPKPWCLILFPFPCVLCWSSLPVTINTCWCNHLSIRPHLTTSESHLPLNSFCSDPLAECQNTMVAGRLDEPPRATLGMHETTVSRRYRMKSRALPGFFICRWTLICPFNSQSSNTSSLSDSSLVPWRVHSPLQIFSPSSILA